MSRPPLCKDGLPIASCNEDPARPCAQDKRGDQDRPLIGSDFHGRSSGECTTVCCRIVTSFAHKPTH